MEKNTYISKNVHLKRHIYIEMILYMESTFRIGTDSSFKHVSTFTLLNRKSNIFQLPE